MQQTNTPQATLERLRRDAVAHGVAVALLLCLASMVVTDRLDLGGDYPAKVVVLFVAAGAWLGRYLPEHLPYDRPGPANQVTLLRLALTALLGGLLGETSPNLPWVAFAIAGTVLVLDGVDGWLARRGGWSSRFGARFDMETDALLVVLMAMLVWQFDKAGAWVLLAGAMRYLFVGAGFAWPWLRRPLPDSGRRKTVCVLQILSLLAALLPLVPTPMSAGIAAVGLLLLTGSFLTDVAWLRRFSDQPILGEPLR